MRLTTRGRYAVNAVLDLALHDDSGPVNLADIAKRQHISLAYLEQIFNRLRKRGLVKSIRGPGGGYRLAAGVNDIAIAKVLDYVNEPVDATGCGGMKNCRGNTRCLTHALWTDLNQHIISYLNGVTLADVIRKNKRIYTPDSRSRLIASIDHIE